MMTGSDQASERSRMAREAIAIITRRGEAITRSVLALEMRVSRARVDAVFPEEEDLFAAIVDEWYAHDADFMARIVQSDLPVKRKMFEFFAQRYQREHERYEADPAAFALFVELGSDRFEMIRGYIELADHHLSEIIAEAQADGFFPELSLDRALTLINQMVVCYTSPQMMLIAAERLHEDKLAAIIDTVFAGLSGVDGGARGVKGVQGA